jgi:hypothetical protein
VNFNRARLRADVLKRQGGLCFAALLWKQQSDNVADDNFEPIVAFESLGSCYGKLFVVRIRGDVPRNVSNCRVYCARHAGVAGEEKYKARLGDRYESARKQQGVEKVGNGRFRDRVRAFNLRYLPPEKLGPKSSWKLPESYHRDADSDLSSYASGVWFQGD